MISRLNTAKCSLLLTVCFAVDGAGQTLPTAPEPPTIGSTLAAEILQNLPTAANLFSVLETTQPELIADRFNSSGLNAGDPSRIAGFLSSWSQTQYRLGDVNISSPNDGAPLLFPEVAFWDGVGVTTGLMPADINAPGLAVSLEPRRPSSQWMRMIEVSGAGGRLIAASVSDRPPPVARLHDWAHSSVLASGPVIDRRLGLTIGGTWTRNSRSERADPTRRPGEVGSAFAHAVFTPAQHTELRALGWVQRADTTRRDLAVHLQSTFARSARDAASWRIFGGYTQRRRTQELPSSGLVVDRLVDGPIPALVAEGDGTERRWALGARLSPARPHRRHGLRLGADVEVLSVRASPSFAGVIGELIDGLPARLWVYMNPGLESQRRAASIAAYVSDRIPLSRRLTLNAALRVESVHGSADGAASGIGWHTLLPSASIRWTLGTAYDLALVTGYRRSSNQLLLELLASGDPAAPTADVFRWDAARAATSTLIARVGPGGDSAFSRIDPDLRRPHTDEFAIGLESRPQSTLRLGVVAIARRQSALINVVNTGVPMSSYDTFTIADDNVDLLGTADDHELTVYNRLPVSFGRDRYLLTNTDQDPATMGAVVITAQAATDRLFLSIGATASAAVGSGGNRGFRAAENDHDVIGELFTSPNASTFARGRLFGDRAYVIKWTTVYQFPKDIRLGAIARYQDGQPFSRIVVVPGLNQGPEAIQAFANGASRFAFTGTIDARLQKGFAVGAMRLDAILDAYNLLNMNKEVEERVVTGSRFRETTAVQPPRTIHVGVRVKF